MNETQIQLAKAEKHENGHSLLPVQPQLLLTTWFRDVGL